MNATFREIKLLDKKPCFLFFFHFLPRFAIPQITARTAGVNEEDTKSDAAKAVQSIPAYVEAGLTMPAKLVQKLYLGGVMKFKTELPKVITGPPRHGCQSH